ncbi:uncharacterized protein LOC108104978 [Drosophila eugracilis]|uniref:uncharacterized protein LOC108104978 n=1 Tax=Drosophila eugracilis TaxID=29029 RepID=UPI0007E60202|nr:uncharacterized protein LOC108104978 [Drosophila eugracilis]
MQQNIWSSPQVGGSGGALKALARNVANHLKLNRSSMKRVVAQVVAEHHTLGEVADYKGHMYFAKPDRLNFHELIAQSKEAFDDLLLHEPQTAKKRLASKQRFKIKTNSKVNLQMKVSPPQLPISAKKFLNVKKSNKPAVRSMPKTPRPKKTSKTIFQLADAGRRSLNGVIIDESHLPPVGEQQEILLHVPSALVKRSRKHIRQSQTKITSEKIQTPKPSKDQLQKKTESRTKQQRNLKSKNKQKFQKVVKNQQRIESSKGIKFLKEPKKMPPEDEKVNQQVQKNCPKIPTQSPSQFSSRAMSGSPSAPPIRRSISPARLIQKKSSIGKINKPLRTRKSQRRINARGRAYYHRIKAGDTENLTPKPPVQKINTSSKIGSFKKKMPLPRRSYEKPWLVKRSKRQRLSGGSQVAKLRNKEITKKIKRLDKTKTDPKKLENDEKNEHIAKTTKMLQKKSSTQLKTNLSSHIGRQMRNVNFPWYTPYQFQGAAGATQIPNAVAGVPPYKLLKEKYRKLNQRLSMIQPIPQIKRGPNLTSRQMHHRRMQERLMRDLQREEAIDEPLSNGSGVFRRSRGGWQPPRKTKEQTEQPMNKAEEDNRSVERTSSRVKRLENNGRCRQTIATNERIIIPPPKTRNNRNKGMAPNRPVSSPRIRRKFRSVPVGSSLGSIALMSQPEQSKQVLTPAKRHLTIAFMNKRSERTNQTIQPWK